MAVPSPSGGSEFRLSCETAGAKLYYTLDNTDPSESSEYTGELVVSVPEGEDPVTIKVRGYKDGWTPSDIASKTVTRPIIPTALPDGSILFYDRGSQYGSYIINNAGYPRRVDGETDDGSAESTYWRYLICDQHDLDNGTLGWGPDDTNEGLTETAIGVGLPNTNAMIAKYATNTSYWWKLIKEKRDNTGLDWFMPSKDELDMVYDNRTVITGQGGDAFKTDTYYWSSSENGKYYAWYKNFSGSSQNYDFKESSFHCRLLRRI